MSTDLRDDRDRFDLARSFRYGKAIKPTEDHLTLLRRAGWTWDDCEYGAPEIDPKRPYGNSDVEGDLERLLPHLSEQDRIRTHCELVAVLAYICAQYKPEED